VLGELNDAGNVLNIVVLDACRDNPFSWKRSGSRGLQVVSDQPADSIIVYATSAGNTADDNPSGRNGLFTTHLLANLKTPGLSVQELFNRTGSDVRRASGGRQVPAVYSQFFETAYLGGRSAVAKPMSVQPVAPPVQSAPANMEYINGGIFTMGSFRNSESEYYENDKPQHRVTVSSFYIGKYEVTQAEYQSVMGSNPSEHKGSYFPVANVSWFDAVEYCNKLSQREGLIPAYTVKGSGNDRTVTWNRNVNGYRLPTEAEWEYACRAGTTTDNGGDISDMAWTLGSAHGDIQPIGQKQGNAWGLYDMLGNVTEWCWDWYGGYSSAAQINPVGPPFGSERVVRGGGSGTIDVYFALRWGVSPVDRSRFDIWGFRLARNVQ
jgi:formylglycine-generating enzyme required for sulfatase activity